MSALAEYQARMFAGPERAEPFHGGGERRAELAVGCALTSRPSHRPA